MRLHFLSLGIYEAYFQPPPSSVYPPVRRRRMNRESASDTMGSMGVFSFTHSSYPVVGHAIATPIGCNQQAISHERSKPADPNFHPRRAKNADTCPQLPAPISTSLESGTNLCQSKFVISKISIIMIINIHSSYEMYLYIETIHPCMQVYTNKCTSIIL